MVTIALYIVIDDKYIFNWVGNVEIVSSYDLFTDTATITLPDKVIANGKMIRLSNAGYIKKGMKILVRLGYSKTLKTIFKGYISSVSNSLPFTIKCEDEMYMFKKNIVKPKTFESTTLGELVNYCVSGATDMTVRANDVNVGKFIIQDKVPGIKVMEELKRLYEFQFFIRDDKIYAGLPYWTEYQNEIEFTFGTNIFENDSLKVVSEDDQKIKLKAISILENNTKLEVEVGDAAGGLRTWYFDGVTDKASLKKFAKQKLEELQYTGLEGSYKTFGFPQVKHGDIIKLVDPLQHYRSGRYLVKKVTTLFGVSHAYEQIIWLGRKII